MTMTTTKRVRHSDAKEQQRDSKKARTSENKRATSEIARELFERAVHSRVARFMEQNDIMLITVHKQLRNERVKVRELGEEIERLKNLVARQQVELLRLEEENKKEKETSKVSFDPAFDSIDLDNLFKNDPLL